MSREGGEILAAQQSHMVIMVDLATITIAPAGQQSHTGMVDFAAATTISPAGRQSDMVIMVDSAATTTIPPVRQIHAAMLSCVTTTTVSIATVRLVYRDHHRVSAKKAEACWVNAVGCFRLNSRSISEKPLPPRVRPGFLGKCWRCPLTSRLSSEPIFPCYSRGGEVPRLFFPGSSYEEQCHGM